ncbi:hypothetical protein WAI453_013091 [Rhynchosporium graminicola]
MYLKTFTAALVVSVMSRTILAAALERTATERSNNSQCGQIYITGFLVPNCTSTSADTVIAPIGNTDGIITPLL